MLARALLRMIWSIFLLLHMLPFTFKYSPASSLVVMVLLSSSGCFCKSESARLVCLGCPLGLQGVWGNPKGSAITEYLVVPSVQ